MIIKAYHKVHWMKTRSSQLREKHQLNKLTGSVDGEKNAKNNVNNKLINICFTSKLAIWMTSKNVQIFSERFLA